jgi:hypothetical protein
VEATAAPRLVGLAGKPAHFFFSSLVVGSIHGRAVEGFYPGILLVICAGRSWCGGTLLGLDLTVVEPRNKYGMAMANLVGSFLKYLGAVIRMFRVLFSPWNLFSTFFFAAFVERDDFLCS